MPTNDRTNAPLVLAFYHPWYGTPWGSAKGWRKWDSFQFPDRYRPERIRDGWRRDIASGDYPLIGPYDVSEAEVVRWHFRLAKAAGIDGFICSWWKMPRPDPAWDWQYEVFYRVWLPVAKEEDFALAVLDECAHYVRDYHQLLFRVMAYLPICAAYPGYLRINGQPVWYVYQVWDDWLTAEQAEKFVKAVHRQIGDVFWIFDKLKATATTEPPGAMLTVRPEWLAIKELDCFGAYSLFAHWRETDPAALRKLYGGFVENVRHAGKVVQLPVLPGHDNTAVNDQPYVVPRREGTVLRNFLQAVDAARPEIVVVCSFNEWLEMTQIEPAANWDDPYLYLKLLAEWRGKKWHAPPLPPVSVLDSLIGPKLEAARTTPAGRLP